MWMYGLEGLGHLSSPLSLFLDLVDLLELMERRLILAMEAWSMHTWSSSSFQDVVMSYS